MGGDAKESRQATANQGDWVDDIPEADPLVEVLEFVKADLHRARRGARGYDLSAHHDIRFDVVASLMDLGLDPEAAGAGNSLHDGWLTELEVPRIKHSAKGVVLKHLLGSGIEDFKRAEQAWPGARARDRTGDLATCDGVELGRVVDSVEPNLERNQIVAKVRVGFIDGDLRSLLGLGSNERCQKA